MRLIATRKRLVSLVFIIALAASCGGATMNRDSATSSAQQAQVLPPQKPSMPDKVYEIQAGDRLDIKFFYNPELNESDLPVRPDGRISLQLVGDVPVSGLTPSSVRELLKRKYEATELRDVEVVVIVRSFGPQPPAGEP